MSLGFRKNDYRHLVSDGFEDDSEEIEHDNGIPFSEVLGLHDDLWIIWKSLETLTDDLGVPLLDNGNYTNFLNFITRNNPYLE